MTTNVERLAKLEEKVDNLEDQNTKEHLSILEALKENSCKMAELIEGMDKKYASKLTERIVYAMVGTVAMVTLYYILTHVGIKP
jgi:hypothetical protein